MWAAQVQFNLLSWFFPVLVRIEATVLNQQQPLNTSAGFLLLACYGRKEGVSLLRSIFVFSSFKHSGKMLLVLAALGKDFSPLTGEGHLVD